MQSKFRFIPGFVIGNYRSFGHDAQMIGPCDKINIFIGKNNSGKSNILRYVSSHYWDMLKSTKTKQAISSFSTVDVYRNGETSHAFFGRIVNLTTENWAKALESKNVRAPLRDQLEQALHYDQGRQFGLIMYEATTLQKGWQLSTQWLQDIFPKGNLPWGELSSLLTGSQGGQRIDDVIRVMDWIVSATEYIGNSAFIPAVRQIGQSGDVKGERTEHRMFRGAGIIEELAKLERPTDENLEDKQKFESLRDFVRDILENKTVQIEIPHDRTTIHVSVDGRSLPIENLGTGVHEVVMLARIIHETA